MELPEQKKGLRASYSILFSFFIDDSSNFLKYEQT